MVELTKTQHIVRASHPRYHARAYARPDARLELVVNQYSQIDERADSIRVLWAHANGFVKELYEPLIKALMDKALEKNIHIGSVYIADAVNQGDSYLRNSTNLGDSYSWYDGGWDQLEIIRQLEIPEPIFAIGHSYGSVQLMFAGMLQPLRFAGMVAIEPILSPLRRISEIMGAQLLNLSARRRDQFPTRAKAQDYMKSRPFFKNWDPECVRAYLDHGMVNRPDGSVMLKTTTLQECLTFGHHLRDRDSVRGSANDYMYLNLENVRPRPFVIVGADSDVCNPAFTNTIFEKRIPLKTLPNCGHLLCFERVDALAAQLANYLSTQLPLYNKQLQADREQPRDWDLQKIVQLANQVTQSKL